MFNNSLQSFAVEGIHVSLKAEPITKVGSLTITNAMIYGLFTVLFVASIFIIAAKSISYRPIKSSFTGAVEYIIEFVMNLMTTTFGSREKAAKYTPYFGTFFLFIVFSNIMGTLPFVGPGVEYGGSPLLRPLTADLNGTIAMSVIAIILVQFLSIKEQGFKGHLKHYFTDKPLNPVNMLIGLLEVFGEFTRIMSLSLRLFLNTAVGEILISVFTSMIAPNGRTPIAVIPIFFFEFLVAGIQAYVFTLLAATYLNLAIMHADHGEEHEVHHAPDTINTKVETVS